MKQINFIIKFQYIIIIITSYFFNIFTDQNDFFLNYLNMKYSIFVKIYEEM